jgi:predicted nuclease of restriction endonuclease-like (RecB) superfamily
MGKRKKDVIIPVAPAASEINGSYKELVSLIKTKITDTRLKVVLLANSNMVILYWEIGSEILKKQTTEGWGAKVIDRLSKDLLETFPDMKGFSPRNLKYMRRFSVEFPNSTIVQQGVAQLPWRSIIVLLDKLKDNESRLLYAQEAVKNGWSSNILQINIESRSLERLGKSVNNFEAALPPAQSDMALNIFKDPYLFDFLGTDIPRRELEVEKKLTQHMRQ